MEILQKLLTVKPGMIARRSLLNTNPRSFKNDRSTRVTKVDVDCQAERSNIENLHKIVMPITYQGLLTSGVAFAEASTESVEQAAATPEWLSYFLVALPLLAYGGFTIFREKVRLSSMVFYEILN